MFDFVELTINQRQTGNDPLRDICMRLRVGKTTREDIETLQDRVLRPSDPLYQTKLKEFEDAIWAFPTIKLANRYNMRKTRQLGKTTTIYKIFAQDTYADGTKNGRECPRNIIPTKINKTAGIPSQIHLGIGSRVMLRRNKDVETGLVNGAVGSIVGFQWNYGRNQGQPGDLPRSVSVKFDHLPHPININCMEFQFYGKNNTLVSRRMLPFICSFGQNFHKLQVRVFI